MYRYVRGAWQVPRQVMMMVSVITTICTHGACNAGCAAVEAVHVHNHNWHGVVPPEYLMVPCISADIVGNAQSNPPVCIDPIVGNL